MEFMNEYILQSYNYWVSILLMVIGLYGVINAANLIKKLMGLGIFQTSVLLFYISIGSVRGGHVPILDDSALEYVNPLPHVLMLTAIVVGVATLAVGLAIAVRIKEEYGTVEEDEILAMEKHTIEAALSATSAPVSKPSKRAKKKPATRKRKA
jgi:multicomponent Na+:H+ antiporter subunit C